MTLPLWAVAAWGQEINPNRNPADIFIEPPEPTLPDTIEIPVELPPLSPRTQPIAPPDSAPPNLQTYPVDRFQVEGSTVFSVADFNDLLTDFQGKPLSIVELQQAADLIQGLYLKADYITSGAIFLAYAVESRTAIFQVIEGKIADIRIQVIGGELEDDYVKSRLNLATTTPLHQETVLDALKLLQLDPNIDAVQAELAAAPEPGENILNVVVTTSDRLSTSIFSNNNRSPSVGSEGGGTSFNIQNVSGWGDNLSISPSITEGSNSLNVRYTLPVSPHNTQVYASAGLGHSRIIEDPFDRLDIQSESTYFNLGISHPLKQTPTEELALSLEVSHSRSQTTLLNIPFPLSPGADLEGRTRVSALRLGQAWTTQGEDFLLALRSRFSIGVNIFDATINEISPDSRFFSWQGQVQWVKLLDGGKKVILRGEAQLSDRPLLSGEQFGLGGQSTVRGYRQNALLTDNGLLGVAELYVPVLTLGDELWTVELIPFFNFGTGWNNGESEQPETQTLVSFGSGLQVSLSDIFSARLDWGIPLVHLSDTNETWQENGLYFQLLYNPF
ncbi:MAG: ShlB/FhaC/HecB family hemolysin secretion/activation protein [Cyanobacteria bacterium P01_G01_bin.54]